MGGNTNWTANDLMKKGIKTDGSRFTKEELAPKKRVKVPVTEFTLPPDWWKVNIFIPGNVPSSKNSRINSVRMDGNDKIIRKDNGKIDSISVGSKLVSEYKRETRHYWEGLWYEWDMIVRDLKKPLEVEFFFVRDSNRKADFHNLVQLPLDLMQDYGWIPDDDMTTVFPYPPEGPIKYGVDKTKPGVYIRIRKPKT